MITDKDFNGHKRGSNAGQNFGKGAIALAILAGVMGFTNPPRDEYLKYASGAMATEIKKSVCKPSHVPDFLGNFAQTLIGVCNGVLTSERSTMERLIDNTTERQNLILFSIYTTEVVGKKYHTIGAFGNFLSIPAK
ncbi:hypothetical protein BCD67_18185 [Oscillatoriales cyanobacterium USR001]|nr:hypothetical protein BCD67_18185 [Oscillatoriales cyanobacterium USR001]